ncbi:redoxin domain-containing protein [Natronorarus salvus]|uniref:redoxin domain-containing protein n=1 Tax=Natronorarus salvus TaxID=3117733 RepID=UPI002F260944
MVDFDVVSLPPADHPESGEGAPEFTRPLVNREFWEDVSLSELTDEGPVLLVFHSMDGAFPALYTWKEVQERDLDERVRVVGLSISTPYEHKRFLEERDLDASLFSDPSNDIAEAYGVVNDLDGMSGVSEPRPAVFLIDGGGTIGYAWAANEHPDFPEWDEVEDAIDDL